MKTDLRNNQRKRQEAEPLSPATGAEQTPSNIEQHPLAPFAGKFEGKEWEALLEAIQCNRKAIDAQEADVE